MSQFKLAVVAFGRPGSGKGEVKKHLISKFPIQCISTGEYFRKKFKNPQFAAQAARNNGGDLVNDPEVIEVVRNKIVNAQNVVFDGFPRSVPQAEALRELLDTYEYNFRFVIELNVDRDICVQRIMRRGLESGRDDDKNLEVIAHRMDVYEGYAPKTLKILKDCMSHVTIDASQSLEKVLKDVEEIVCGWVP